MQQTSETIAEPYIVDDEGDDYVLLVFDDQPIPEGRKYAPEMRCAVQHRGEQVRQFYYPSYRIWTLVAHWRDSLGEAR